ncbi:UNVERIFIED_CONTAM: hypothetical protein NCL1_44296 [Trichonephila clavipes]
MIHTSNERATETVLFACMCAHAHETYANFPPFSPINALVEKWRLVSKKRFVFSCLQRQNLLLLCNERSILSSVVNLQMIITFLGGFINLKRLDVFVKGKVRGDQGCSR